MDPSSPSSEDILYVVSFASVAVSVLVALPGVIVLTLAIIRWFRNRVGRSMRATGGAVVPPEIHHPLSRAPQGTLELEPIAASRERAAAAHAVPLLAEARRQARRLAALYALAAAGFPLLFAAGVIIAISFSPSGFSPSRNVVLYFALLYSVFALVYGTPVVLAPMLVLKRQPRFLLLGVVALIVALWACERSIGGDLIRIWLIGAGVPAVAVLLLNTRHLRAVGPIIFAQMLLCLYGLAAGFTYAIFYLLNAVRPVQFVRDDLAGKPWREAVNAYFAWLKALPQDQRWDAISTLIANPLSVLHFGNPEGLTATVWLHAVGVWLAATAVGGVAAWTLGRWLAWRYGARRASDQMLTLDTLMLSFTLWVALVFATVFERLIVASAVAGFIGYKLLAQWGLRYCRGGDRLVPARTLLLLRVFGFERRTQRLLEQLGLRWRYLGPIRLIAGTDLAYATIEPHEYFEFLNGRLSRAFVTGREDLEGRVSQNILAPDPDGLFRIEDFFCHEDTWRMTVSRLARKADAVLMDLRGFTPMNRGCIFEIEQLIAVVALRRLVLLVDGSTDMPFLEQILQGAWRAMPGDSPNADTGKHRLQVLQASTHQGYTLDSLLALLCDGFSERVELQEHTPTAPSRPSRGHP